MERSLGATYIGTVLVPLDGVNFDAVRIQTVVLEYGLGYKTVFCVEMPSNESYCGKVDNPEAAKTFDQCSVRTLDMWQWPSEEEELFPIFSLSKYLSYHQQGRLKLNYWQVPERAAGKE